MNEFKGEKLHLKSYVLIANGDRSLPTFDYKYLKYCWLAVHGFSAHNARYEDLGGVDGEQLGEGARVGGAVRELAQHQHGVPHAEAGDAHLPLHTHRVSQSEKGNWCVDTNVEVERKGKNMQIKRERVKLWKLWGEEKKQDKNEETEDKN